ncbi:MAG TPA: hypothetical protein VF119_07665 [Candidatus Limnocylindrales bacterium]
MFDLSLAHISHDEQERDLVVTLHDRQVLKASSDDATDSADAGSGLVAERTLTARAPIDRPVARRHATGALGRQG